MKFQEFINEAKTEDLDTLYAVTDGKKYYALNGSTHPLNIFKDNGVLHESKKDAQLVLDNLPPEDGYEGLKIVKVNITATIEDAE